MNEPQNPLTLHLNNEERVLLLEAIRNQREFVIEDGYMPVYVDKFIDLTAKVEQAMGIKKP